MRIVNEPLLEEFRALPECEFCGKPAGNAGLDACHIFSRGAGRVDIRCNLLGMHRLCHSKTEKNPDCKKLLLVIASVREDVMIEDIEPAMMFIRNQLDKHDSSRVIRQKINRADLTPSVKRLLRDSLWDHA